MRRIAIAATALLAFTAGVVVPFQSALQEFRAHALGQQQSRQEPLTSYYDVKLGSSKNEVGYTLGYPSSVQGPIRRDPHRKDWLLRDELKLNGNGEIEGTPHANDPPGGSALQKSDEWNYDFLPDRVTITFDPVAKTVVSISCIEWKNTGPSKCRQILGVTVGSTEADTLKALGTPDDQFMEGVYKGMSYRDLGIELMLAKRRVYLIRKVNPGRQVR